MALLFPVRSWLCAPSLNAGLVDRAIAVDADIVHFDLEDSVRPEDKQKARLALLPAYAAGITRPTAIRINPLTTEEGLRDLLFLVDHNIVPEIVILAKASIPGDVAIAHEVLGKHRPDVALFAVIELVQTLWDLRNLTKTPEGLSGVIFGSADFAADFGVDPRTENLRFARQEIAFLARRLGISAIDAPCFQFRDAARLQEELRFCQELGFGGKIAIHPGQVAALNEAFTPSHLAIADAKKQVAIQEQKGPRSVIPLGAEAVGPPHLKHKRTVLAQAALLATGKRKRAPSKRERITR